MSRLRGKALSRGRSPSQRASSAISGRTALEPLIAVSSIDGRYRDVAGVLAAYGSEYARIRARVLVECEYLIALSHTRKLGMRTLEADEEELVRKLKSISSGGTLVKRLEDLVNAGFIMSFKPHQHKKKGLYYKVIDEYSLFYFQWIEPVKSTLLGKGLKPGYWDKIKVMPACRSWAGYAFESLCYKHLVQISEALHLSPTAIPNTWRFAPKAKSKESGAQIDLLFDRDDGVINLCDMKYTDTAFIIDKKYAAEISRKIEVFKEKTRTEKQILFSMISASGLKETIYSEEMIDGVVILDDLFKAEV